MDAFCRSIEMFKVDKKRAPEAGVTSWSVVTEDVSLLRIE